MSIHGILDASRSDRPPGERLVWLCLENHANGHRFWRMTDKAIADELQLGLRTVRRAIARLVADGIVKVERFKRRPSVFHMLRDYTKPNGKTPQPHEDLSGHSEHSTTQSHADLSGQNDILNSELSGHRGHSSAELSGQNGHTKESTSKNPPKGSPPTTRVPARTPPRGGCAIEPPGFAAFWQDYPRKVGRRAAAIAFAAAIKRGTHPDDILDGLNRAEFNLEPRWQPHPTTWLNQERWRDEANTGELALSALKAAAAAAEQDFNLLASFEKPRMLQ